MRPYTGALPALLAMDIPSAAEWGELPDALTALLSRMGLRARRVASLSVGSSSVTPISWDTEDADTDAMLSPHATTGTTITIPADGLWAISVTVTTALAASVRNFVEIVPSAGTGALPTGTPANTRAGWTGGTEGIASVSTTIALAAGNTFVANVFHSMSGAQNFSATLQCHRIGS